MKVQTLLLSLAAILTTAYFLQRLSTYLYFGEITDGQPVPGTDFVYTFQDIDVIATGTFSREETFKRTDVYLVNTKTDQRFEIPAGFNFRETAEGLVCRHCVAVIQKSDRVYLVTRTSAGGSGDYYSNILLEVTDQEIINQGQYLSCGKTYVRNNQITFPSHQTSCPELFPNLSWAGWDYRRFNLSEN